jgi:DNA-binding LytR/AlgR family response regulator
VATRTLLVEDEEHARDRLRGLLAAFPEVEVVGEAGDGRSAIERIDALEPDLVFMDIELPEISGLDVLSRTCHRPLVVFVTAYDQYAVRAFEENAVDYLLKPTTAERLGATLERVRTRRGPIDAALLATLRSAIAPRQYPRQLSVRQGESILLVPVASLWWLEAKDRYVVLRTQRREYVSDHTLKDLERELDPDQFLRIHRSVIVSRDRILKIVRSFGGRYAAQMADERGTSFDIGRAYLPRVRERLGF